MKIIQVHNYYQQAGGEDAVVEAELELLRSYGHEVKTYYKSNDGLVTSGSTWVLIGQLIKAGVQTIWNWETYRDFCQVLQFERPDVVHCHNTFPLISPAIYWACASEKIPVVQTLHNFRLACASPYLFREGAVCEKCVGKKLPYSAVRYRCYRRSWAGSVIWLLMTVAHRLLGTYKRKVDAFVALTEFAQEKLVESGVPKHKILVKPNFIQQPAVRCREVAAEVISSPFSVAQKYALFVGRLSPEKGCETLIRAWALFQEEWIASGDELNVPRLLIVGDGPERLVLEELVQSSTLTSVSFMGKQSKERVLELMRNAEILVLPSLWYEGFPMTIVEAFSQSLAVVASNIGSLASAICHKENGLLFAAGDSTELSDALVWAMSHPQEMLKMGDAAHDDYERFYSAEVNYGQLIAIYDQVRCF